MGNWRDKNTYHSADLGGPIIPIGSHTFPEEGQGFFYLVQVMDAVKIGKNRHGGNPPICRRGFTRC